MNLRLHYSRAAHLVSGRRAAACACGLAGALVLLGSAGARAQYVGKVSKDNSTPTLRAVGVLEWTGPAGKPKFSRLVPITVYDGTQLQDGGIYLARPQPLAVTGNVEYQLKQDGRTVGLFDISSAGRQLGTWVGFGDWKPVPHPKPAFAMTAPDYDAEDDDKPVLHRKQHPDEAAGSTSAKNAPAGDSDRPVLHRPASDTSAGDTAGGGTAGNPGAGDDDRPILHEPKPEKKAQPVEDAGGTVSGLPSISDPDRPRLIPGQVNGTSIAVTPDLVGLPPDMKQMVAVSDAVTRPDHPWNYTWANPGDEAKMKAMLEEVARAALAGTEKPAVQPASRARRTTGRKKAAAPPAPEPLELQDEQFRVLELSYGGGATLVLSADTGGPLAQEKFVTLIAQPDLYGNLAVLMKNVTDGSHLDLTPRMKLVDAVDALADNRGELLFELRGPGSRQFALYRVLRGQADRIFVTSGGDFGVGE